MSYDPYYSTDSRPVYAIHPGEVVSKTDGERHFIGYHRLIELYRLPPEKCIEWKFPLSLRGNEKFFIHLYPDQEGVYRNPEWLEAEFKKNRRDLSELTH